MSTGSTINSEVLFEGADEVPMKKSRPKKSVNTALEGDLPINLGKPIAVKVPDFSNPKRPKTCLEVDFPIVPINALSALEANAGKPIYQMSKWWARRRSCVFRAMLLAAAIEAPCRRLSDGSPVLDADGTPIADDTEAAKTVWDAYYGNHQEAGNFKNLKVLDCFMGGGTTLVEGSRLGFNVAGVDLNPVAWFVVKNELSCPEPSEVKELFASVEREVKPQIQPFYVTEEVDGRPGAWTELATGKTVEVDPAELPPRERDKYNYTGPEVIYTFWAKHGPCAKPGCNHRTPIFRSPIIAAKSLGVKYLALTCKACKTAFHAELGSARLSPASDRVVLQNEASFTELSREFSALLSAYNDGNRAVKAGRIQALVELVEHERGLRCPRCSEFAGQHVRDVLKAHSTRSTAGSITKKDFPILPAGNAVKKVHATLLVHTDWLRGSPGSLGNTKLGGCVDSTAAEDAAWYAERLKGLRLIEVRGRHDEPDHAATDEHSDTAAESDDTSGSKGAGSHLPSHITLGDGTIIDTAYSTVPKESHFTCGACGLAQDLRISVERTGMTPPVMAFALQCYSPKRASEGYAYSGRYFRPLAEADAKRLVLAAAEWQKERADSLVGYWPQDEIPDTYMTQRANFSLAKQGYTHWNHLFNQRQLLSLARLFKAIASVSGASLGVRSQALGAFQQYLRCLNMFCSYDMSYDKITEFFSNSNYRPVAQPFETGVFAPVGSGLWRSCTSKVIEALEWVKTPHETFIDEEDKSRFVRTNDPVVATEQVFCGSSTELDFLPNESFDLVITDPPFGDNINYADLADFFYAWIRLAPWLQSNQHYQLPQTPKAQECIASRGKQNADEFYETTLSACFSEVIKKLKAGGLLAFTFHHSEDEQWAIVLNSLFSAGFYLESCYPIYSDTSTADGAYGSKQLEYDIIHVCRKRLGEPRKVSWAKMRQWVRSELGRLRRLLEVYRSRELPDGDVRVILRGKALEFYSRHFGAVYTSEDLPLSIRDALLGINQLLDEDSDKSAERPPSIVQPVVYQFLRLFGPKMSMNRNEVGMQLRGTGIVMREFEGRGWVHEEDKTVHVMPIRERFDIARQRPRKEMRTELDQAHFLIGAAMRDSGVNIEQEFSRDTWMIRRSVEAVLLWYAKTSADPEVREAAELAAKLLKTSLEQNRAKLVHEQGFLFDDLDENAD